MDPFSGRTVISRKCYFRLHGRGGWSYSYEDAESYVFFDNIRMKMDALRFKWKGPSS